MNCESCILFFLVLASGTAYGRVSAEMKSAYREGAMSKVVYRVVDDDGMVVTNATADIWYSSYGRPQDNAHWRERSDSNGVFVAEHRTNERLSVYVYKDGHYGTRDAVSYFDSTNAKVKDGKWQPYGEMRTVVLKRILNPVPMDASDGLSYYKYPPSGVWAGFDLQRRDWTTPYGNGKFPDMLVRFQKMNTADGYLKTMEVSFTNNLFAGFYQMPMDRFSEMQSCYHASTNACYLKTVLFEVCRDKKGLHRKDLDENHYLVLRTRTTIDKDGKLLSAHYGKIYGDWRFCERGGMAIQQIFFNPLENDTNLEDEKTVKESDDLKNAIKGEREE
jgi:hypothetical protein